MIPGMRTFEILLIFLNLLGILEIVFPRIPKKRRPLFTTSLTFLSTIAAAIHLLLEGYRWQMLPIYLLTGLLLLNRLLVFRPPRINRDNPNSRFRRLMIVLPGLVMIGLGLTLSLLFPVPQVPSLTGPYPVGTTIFHLVDSERLEIYTASQEDLRELMVQVWYPAAPSNSAEPGPWMAEAAVAGPAIARRLDLPVFLLDHLQLVRTHAVVDALPAVAQGPFPVLLFSHGWGGLRTQNITLVEELASHGFVVAAADHTYGAVVTVFPGDRVALWNPNILRAGVSQADYDAASNQLVRTWAGDLAFILDHLQRLASGGGEASFSGLLDFERVGVIGHSTGGGTAVEWCAEDVRCQAGFTMDAWLEPVSRSVIEAGLEQPFLFLRSEAWEQPARNPRNDRLQVQLLEHLRGPGYRLAVQGTEHYDFSSLPLFSPLAPALGLKGPIPGPRINEIVNTYARAFFSRQLLGEVDPLLDGPSARFPEVDFQ